MLPYHPSCVLHMLQDFMMQQNSMSSRLKTGSELHQSTVFDSLNSRWEEVDQDHPDAQLVFRVSQWRGLPPSYIHICIVSLHMCADLTSYERKTLTCL